MDVLVIITDMTNYCDALREISTAREELPGGGAIPDICTLTRIALRTGREDQGHGRFRYHAAVVTMPEDDITHPIPTLPAILPRGRSS